MHQWFLSFKMCIFNSLDPSCLQNVWFWKVWEGERETKVIFMKLCISPAINVSSIMRKANLDQAFSPLSGHIYQPEGWLYILISWLIFEIYRNALTAKVFGHLYDSNIKQHKEVDAPCPKGFLLPFKSFFKCALRGRLSAMHWRSSKKGLLRNQKEKVSDVITSLDKKPSLQSSENERIMILGRTLKTITDGSHYTHGVVTVFHWSTWS